LIFGPTLLTLIGAAIFSFPYFKFSNDSFAIAGGMIGGGSETIYRFSFIVTLVMIVVVIVATILIDRRVEDRKERV
jgi:multisubunit Na+/H+ antiporter MnhB subunit